MRVSRRFAFEAAHHLPDYPGECARLHGHSYKVEVTVEGKMNENGMVLDFKLLKKCVQRHIDYLDHRDLNEIIGDHPTAEVLACWLFMMIMEDRDLPKLASVKVWETEDSYAEALPEDFREDTD